MSELGQILRNARLDKKISLDDLQETTKIRKAYLEAIEEGRYKMLPGNFYVRAFIKSYAETVGLDPNEVLKLYQSDIPAPEQTETIEPPRKKRVTRNSERIGKWVSTVMVISFAVLIMGFIYYYLNTQYNGVQNADPGDSGRITDKREPQSASGGNQASQQSEAQPISSSETDKPAVPESVIPEPPKPEVQFVRSERGVDYYTVENAESMEVKMLVTGEACWVQVKQLDADKKSTVIEQKEYSNGEVAVWPIAPGKNVYITLGRANAVELTLNGVDIPVGSAPNVKKIQADLAKLPEA